MKHWVPGIFMSLIAACAGHAPPRAAAPVPAAGDVPAPAQASQPAPVPIAPAVIAAAAALADTAAAGDSTVDAETAADQAVLDKLAESAPDSAISGDDAAALGGATWNIDVASYANHERVQYYLDFFRGEARDRMAIWLTRMPKYETLIRTRLQQQGLPSDMIYLALIESGFSNSAVSRSKAAGMWQFMKGTARLYGLRVDPWVDERRDPIKSTDAAARLLSDLRRRFGSLYLAAAAYNAGAGRVGRGLRRLPDDESDDGTSDATFFRLADTKSLRRETKDYVPKLIAAALIAKEPEVYGFAPIAPAAQVLLDSLVVPDATGLEVIARLADTSLAAIRELNPQFLRLATPPGRKMVVRLPPGRGMTVAARYDSLPASKRVTFREHFVSPGETLSGIALRYHVSVDEILAANRSVKPRALRLGQRLIIPTAGVAPPREAYAIAADRPARPRARVDASGLHLVKNGESLWTIARDFSVTIEQLRGWNGLEPSEVLKAGQRIRVNPPGNAAPGKAGLATTSSQTVTTHLVRPGDTLSEIAERYDIPESELRRANGLGATSMIRIGDRLKIPARSS